MSNKMTPQQLEEINMDRAAWMAKTLMAVGGFPVLVCGVIPGPESKGNQLVSFAFSGADKAAMREMLMEYLRVIDGSSYHVPAGYGKK
jgi:hypothetical protein